MSLTVKKFCRTLTTSRPFELVIIGIILVNTVLTGIDPHEQMPVLRLVQRVILGMFTVEIIFRFLARKDISSFFKDGWNLFDLSLVILGWIPEGLFVGSHQLVLFRAIRVVRVLRLLRISDELRLIVGVLVKSFKSLFYNAVFFFTFMYLFAILGVILFRVQIPEERGVSKEKIAEYETLKKKLKDDMPEKFDDAALALLANYDNFHREDPNAGANVDPYDNVPEAMFTLFRIATGDDWTIVPYGLRIAYTRGLIASNSTVITFYHVTWFALAVFLLLNLLLGAIVNNYEMIMDEMKGKRFAKTARENEPLEGEGEAEKT
ncbi:MAG: ion transporter [Puniceicoccales bacterium]|jgi:voltage-gated sodium channel|nr:ion transporter [Puniceicoccales bacterium]